MKGIIMPNGDFDWPEKELPQLEVFFSKIAGVLNKFEQDCNLKIERYYRQMPGWRFGFRHIKGGAGYIDVLKVDEKSVKLNAVWWIDDYDTGTRFTKTSDIVISSLDEIELYDKLTEMIKLVFSWQQEDLSPYKSEVYQRWKETWTKEDFERLNDKYPLPKID